MSWLDRLTGRADLVESLQETRKELDAVQERLTEALSALQMYDPDMNLTAAQGGSAYFRRLTQTPRDFPPMQHEKALKLAFWLYETNPIARRILSTTAAYIIGDGFDVTADYKEQKIHDAVQAQVDRFWGDHVNLMDLRLPGMALELGMWGELCLTVDVNPIDGLVRIGMVDPERVAEIINDVKGDVVAVQLSKLHGVGEVERLKVVQVDEDPSSDSFDHLVGAKTDPSGNVIETWQATDTDGKPVGEPKPYLGSCFIFRANKVSSARRGRSDLLAVMDWLDAYDQELFNELERSALLKAFIWDVKLTGMDEAQIKAWLKNNGAPKAGAVRAHNEGVEWNAVSPDLKPKDSQALADLILGHISTGAQYPKTWLNITDDVNRATGQVLDEPTFRWMSARQRLLRYIVEQLVVFHLDQVSLAGKLDKRPKLDDSIHLEPWQISVNAPELRTKDLKAGGETLTQTMQGLAAALSEEIIDKDTAQRVIVMLIEQLGVDVDLDEMRQNIEQEQKEKEAKLTPAVVPPDPSDPNAPPSPQEGQGQTQSRPATPVLPIPARQRLAPRVSTGART